MDVHYTEARWTVDCNVLLMHFNFSAKNNYLGQEFGLHVYIWCQIRNMKIAIKMNNKNQCKDERFFKYNFLLQINDLVDEQR